MGYRSVAGMLDDFRRLLRRGRALELAGDAALVEEFVRQRSQDAFASLVERHGSLVIGVCQRILSRDHDIEDAFQATFLVLARKAHTIRRRQSLCGWLAKVARRIAWTVRKQQTAERQRAGADGEAMCATSPDPDPARRAEQRDTAAVVGEEIERLPEKYRMLVILCDLLGRSHAEAAQELACPTGSIARHLARGRALLRERLSRRGLSAGTVALTALVADRGEAAVPASWLKAVAAAAVPAANAATIPAGLVSERALTLSQGVLKSMWLKQLCAVLLVPLTLGLLTVGVVMAARSVGGPSEPDAGEAAPVEPNGESKGGKDAEQPKPAGGDKGPKDKIKELQKKRLGLATEAYKLYLARFNAGVGLPVEVANAAKVLAQARLDVCETKEERIKACEQNLQDMEHLDKMVDQFAKAGTAPSADAALLRGYVVEAQIALEKAKLGK